MAGAPICVTLASSDTRLRPSSQTFAWPPVTSFQNWAAPVRSYRTAKPSTAASGLTCAAPRSVCGVAAPATMRGSPPFRSS